MISALKEADSYEVALADNSSYRVHIENFTGLHSAKEEVAIIDAIAQADLVTTAIGPNVLPVIAKTIAKDLDKRTLSNV